MRDKQEITQYIYDYGIDKTCELLHLNKDKVEEITGLKHNYQSYAYNTVISKPLCINSDYIIQILSSNYDKLYSDCQKYCYKDTIYMSQDLDDIFHNAIIKTVEKGIEGDLTEENILKEFIIYFKMALKYTKLQAYSMKGKIKPLEVKNEDNEYIIPAELYHNAYTKETD